MLVCDNATIHQQGYNSDLGDFLWNTPALDGEPLRILLLPLPTRSPELNPIELVWHILVQRVKYGVKRVDEQHAVARAAEAKLIAIVDIPANLIIKFNNMYLTS